MGEITRIICAVSGHLSPSYRPGRADSRKRLLQWMAKEKLLKAMLYHLLREERVVLSEKSCTALRHGDHCSLLPLRYLPSGLDVRLQSLQHILWTNIDFLVVDGFSVYVAANNVYFPWILLTKYFLTPHKVEV